MTQIKSGSYIEVTLTDATKELQMKIVCENFYEFKINCYFKLIDTLICFKNK